MMRAIRRSVAGRLLVEEQGGELIEYALIVGLIVVICLLCVTNVGTKLLQRWNSIWTAL
jgi:Flp pilus assembly pilin Flp